jgi:hypothetical protein
MKVLFASVISGLVSSVSTVVLLSEVQKQQQLETICKVVIQLRLASSCRPLTAGEREESKWTTYYP